MNQIVFLFGFGVILILIGYFIYNTIEYDKIKKAYVLNGRSSSQKDLMDTIAQLKIVKNFEKLNKDKTQNLLYTSLDPVGFTPGIYNCITKLVPVVIMLLGLALWSVTDDYSYFAFSMLFVLGLAFGPTFYYKGRIKDRELAWDVLYTDIWRFKLEASVNDIKTALVNMGNYYEEKGETELAFGFKKFFDFFPQDESEIPLSKQKIQELFPFDIPNQFYDIILTSWQYSQSIEDRLESFKQVLILKYRRTCEEQISKIPTQSTIFSLPFLLIAVLFALIIPCVPSVLQALG